jgi:hypothetical protein
LEFRFLNDNSKSNAIHGWQNEAMGWHMMVQSGADCSRESRAGMEYEVVAARWSLNMEIPTRNEPDSSSGAENDRRIVDLTDEHRKYGQPLKPTRAEAEQTKR